MNENGRGVATPVRVLGIGGSMRQGSKSLALLRGALGIAEEAGAIATLADVRELSLPIYDDDLPLAAYPPTLSELLAAAREADAYILCSPTYHGTVSGVVKNALDLLNFLVDDSPPYFGGKPVALMALGGGGAANVLTSLHHTARALNGLTISTVVMAGGGAIADSVVTDPNVQRRLLLMVDELLDLATRLRRPTPTLAHRA
jgi:FMN reductase